MKEIISMFIITCSLIICSAMEKTNNEYCNCENSPSNLNKVLIGTNGLRDLRFFCLLCQKEKKEIYEAFDSNRSIRLMCEPSEVSNKSDNSIYSLESFSNALDESNNLDELNDAIPDEWKEQHLNEIWHYYEGINPKSLSTIP